MTELTTLSSHLELSPEFLKNLISGYSTDVLKARRIPGRWSAHEHACHVCVGEKYSFHKRIPLFLHEDHPSIEPISGNDFPSDFYHEMNIDQCLNEFFRLRAATVSIIRTLPPEIIDRTAYHPEYTHFTPRIMARHLLMHDHYHFYQVEEMLLTKDGCFE